MDSFIRSKDHQTNSIYTQATICLAQFICVPKTIRITHITTRTGLRLTKILKRRLQPQKYLQFSRLYQLLNNGVQLINRKWLANKLVGACGEGQCTRCRITVRRHCHNTLVRLFANVFELLGVGEVERGRVTFKLFFQVDDLIVCNCVLRRRLYSQTCSCRGGDVQSTGLLALLLALPDALHHLKPVHHGHLQIGQNEIEEVRALQPSQLEFIQSLRTVLGRFNNVSLLAQHHGHHLQHRHCVVHQQNA
mmetsp:Transcript_33681/g.57790  ORF Transcript_33681/g.57790 Transcript_33681/m.57790 type:complete len:249 (-) Transcript_33681:208-954(-)